MLECMRLAFADALTWVGDNVEKGAICSLLSPEFAEQRTKNVRLDKICTDITTNPLATGDAAESFKQSDTVYFCVVDKFGNGCSMINSNYMGFGTGKVHIE